MSKNDPNETTLSAKKLKDISLLLAYSLAQHREICTQIPLLNASALIENYDPLGKNKKIYTKGEDLYNEASLLLKKKATLSKQNDEFDEHRSQLRLNVATLVHVKNTQQQKIYQGTLADISWGGLQLRTKEVIGNVGDELYLSLPYRDGDDITITSSIIRFWETKGGYTSAMRFSMLSQKNENKLVKLLEVLLDQNDNIRRKDVRFSHRIDISYYDIEELKATLKDISKGEMMITTQENIQQNKSIKVQISGIEDIYSLSLRARVIRNKPENMLGVEMYHIALQFEHPTKELRSMVEAMIVNMMNQGLGKDHNSL